MDSLFFKIAFRYLSKNKLYAVINIIGLAIGLASFIVIMIYVNHERSYDTFKGSENVHRVYMDALEGDTFVAADAQTSNLIGLTLKQEFPEVLEQVKLFRFDKVTFKYKDKIFEETKGSMADATYFNVFNYPLLKGEKERVLDEPNAIVITEDFATKVFGSQNPMQQNLEAFYGGEKVILTVTGILKNIPENTHMKTYSTWFASEEERVPNWSHCNFFTYIKTAKNTKSQLLKGKVIASDFEDDEEERYNIEPLEDIHLYSNKPYEAETNGSITRVKFLSAIAFIILILSWLNYINLSTTKSLERAKEVGIRKVAGAQRTQIIMQSLSESILLNGIAIFLAGALLMAGLATYNKFTGFALEVDWNTIIQLLPTLGIILLGVVLVGLYPAFLLSSYNPSKALKGKIRASAGGLNIRKGLIIMQFLATIVLLVGTLVVTKQINYLQEQPIGADLNNVVAFRGEFLNRPSDSLIRSNYRTLQTELGKLPFVTSSTRAQTFPGDGYENLSSFVGMHYPNKEPDSRNIFYRYQVDSEYFDILDIKFLAGKKFINNAKGESRTIIINEEAMRKIGFQDPQEIVHKKVSFFGVDWTIAGVIENYHHFGLKSEVKPIIIIHGNTSNNLLVKFDPSVASNAGYTAAIAKVQSVWRALFPERTFNYVFLDTKFEAQYKADKTFNKLFNIFTLSAVFIACLGLFGLTSYTCIQRKKEIGVRKVNGATVGQILSLLNKDFIQWVAISFVLAVPISWYAMSVWLSNFANKTAVSWWVYALAGITVLCVALLTVSWQTFKAAMNNPIEVLRDE